MVGGGLANDAHLNFLCPTRELSRSIDSKLALRDTSRQSSRRCSFIRHIYPYLDPNHQLRAAAAASIRSVRPARGGPSTMSSPRTHTLTPLATLTPPSNSRTWQSAPHPTLPIVATACSDRSVRVYSLTSFTLLHSITGGHKRSVRTVSWKPGTRGQSVLATGSFDSSAGIWRREEGGGAVGGMERDFTDAGDTGSDHDDADDYQFSCILDGHESEIKCLAWSPSGQYLATCSRDKSVWIWEELEDSTLR